MIFKDYDFLQNYDLKNFEEKVKIYKELLSKFNRIHNLTYYLNIKGQKLEMTNEINKIILNQLKCYEDVLAKLN